MEDAGSLAEEHADQKPKSTPRQLLRCPVCGSELPSTAYSIDPSTAADRHRLRQGGLRDGRASSAGPDGGRGHLRESAVAADRHDRQVRAAAARTDMRSIFGSMADSPRD